MSIANIIMIVGIFFLILSFFIKDRSKKIEHDLEELSINIYQETNAMKRRLKVVEEELLLDGPVKMSSKPKFAQQSQAVNPYTQSNVQKHTQSAVKPVHSILISQVLELGKQGMTVDEIKKRSALTTEQIVHILKNGGM